MPARNTTLPDPSYYISLARKHKAMKGVKEALNYAASDPIVYREVSEWDPPHLLNTESGVIDLRSRTLIIASPDLCITKTSQLAYDPNAACPRFDQFLEEILPGDLADYVLTVLAYCLLGRPNEQLLFIFVGNGANGKSLLISLIIRMLGDYASTIPAEAISGKSTAGPNESLAKLPGIRMVHIPELGHGLVLNASLIKTLTGGDEIATRRLYGHEFTFKPILVPIMTSNYVPVFDGGEAAMRRRIAIVRFPTTIAEADQDTGLFEVLWAERAGILNRLLERIPHISEVFANPPKEVVAETSKCVASSDLLKGFLLELYEFEEGAKAKGNQLYLAYRHWCGRNGYSPLSRGTFDSAIEARFPQLAKVRLSEGMCWVGLKPRLPLAANDVGALQTFSIVS